MQTREPDGAVSSGYLYQSSACRIKTRESCPSTGPQVIVKRCTLMAGIKNYLEGRGLMLILVPLVALANQKYDRFTERYGK